MFRRFFAAAVAATSVLWGSSALHAATIDLGFALDESGSVSRPDFTLAQNGLANALAQIPTTGENTYRISVVAFNSSARTIVPVTEVTAANLAMIQNTIRTATKFSGGTAIDRAVDLLTANFTAAGLGDTSLFNITTDGQSSLTRLQTSATAASAAGIDGLSFEAVGSANTANLLNVAFPGTPILVDDAANLPNPTEDSFVLRVAGFSDYEAAITAKIGRIVIDTGGGPTPAPVPLPAGLSLMLAAMAAFGGMRMLRSTAG